MRQSRPRARIRTGVQVQVAGGDRTGFPEPVRRRPVGRPAHSFTSYHEPRCGSRTLASARHRGPSAFHCQNHCQNLRFGPFSEGRKPNFLLGPTSLDSGAAHRGPAWSGGRSAASAPSGSFRCPPVPRYRLPGNGLPCSFWPSRPDGTVHQTRRPRPDARSRNSLGRSFLCDGREVCLRTYYLRLRSARMRARGRKRIECRKFGI